MLLLAGLTRQLLHRSCIGCTFWQVGRVQSMNISRRLRRKTLGSTHVSMFSYRRRFSLPLQAIFIYATTTTATLSCSYRQKGDHHASRHSCLTITTHSSCTGTGSVADNYHWTFLACKNKSPLKPNHEAIMRQRRAKKVDPRRRLQPYQRPAHGPRTAILRSSCRIC